MLFYDLKLCGLSLLVTAVCELKFGGVVLFFFLLMSDIESKDLVLSALLFIQLLMF